MTMGFKHQLIASKTPHDLYHVIKEIDNSYLYIYLDYDESFEWNQWHIKGRRINKICE